MRWYQIFVIVVYTYRCVAELILHGQDRTGKHNFWGRLIGTAIAVWLLGQGGFWDGII